MIPEEVIEEIRQRCDIAEIVGEYVNLTRKGDRYWGLSPFKNEKTASFTVTPARNMYYCYATQKGGNVFTFVMEMEGLTFPEAVEYLGKKVGIDVSHSSNPEGNEEFRERGALEELYEKIQESFRYFLTGKPLGEGALEYIRRRGFSDETIAAFDLGYSHPDPFWLHGFLLKKGYSTEFLSKSGLFSKKNPRWTLFSNRLMFPIHRHQGTAIGFGGRLLEGDGPKYINSPDTMIFHKRNNLYGLDLAKDEIKSRGYFILCEGYIDVLAFHQSGMKNAVAPLGTAFTPEQARLLHRFAKKGLLIFDGDAAGIAASQKAVLIMEEEGLGCEVLSLENGMDPADIMLKNGSQDLENLVKSPTTALEFLLAKAVSISDLRSPEGKDLILEQLFPYIRSIKSPVKQEASLQIIAERLSVSLTSIVDAFQLQNDGRRESRASQNRTENERPYHKKSAGSVPVATPDLQLMTAAVIHPEYFEYIRSQLKPRDIMNEGANSLYLTLEEHFRNQTLDFEKIIGDINNESLRDYIMKKAAADEYGNNPDKFIRSAVLRVRHDLLLVRRRDVEFLLKRMEQNGDSGSMRELLEEKIYLDAALRDLKESIHDRTAE